MRTNARAISSELRQTGVLPTSLDDAALQQGLQTLIDQGAKVVSLSAREVLFHCGEERDYAWLLLTGSIDEWASALRLSIRKPGQLVGEMNVLVGGDRYTTTAQLREPTTLLAIPGAALRGLLEGGSALDAWLLRSCAEHGRQWSLSAHWETVQSNRQFFQGDEAQLAPAPYQIKDAVMYGFWVKMPKCNPDKAVMAESGLHPTSPFDFVTPPGVKPLLDAYLLTVNHFPCVMDPTVSKTEKSTYSEIAIMVPCVVGDDPTPRLFYPYLYTGTTMAVYAGREIYGLPKMGAETYEDADIKRLLTRGEGLNAFELYYEELGALGLAEDALHGLEKGLTTGNWPVQFDGHLIEKLFEDVLEIGMADIAKCAMKGFFGHTSFKDCLEGKLKEAISNAANTHGVAWKRIYNPAAELPPGQQVVPWKAEDFQVDGISSMVFRTEAVHSLDLIQATDVFAQPPFLWSDVELAFPVGMRMTYDMVMEPDVGMLVDFIKDPPQDLARLAWGPGIWQLPEKVYMAGHDIDAPAEGTDSIAHFRHHPHR